MKIQIQQQSVRIRVDEAELARLLAGEPVGNHTVLGDGLTWSQQLRLGTSQTPRLDGQGQHLRVLLPHAAVLEYSQRLPCREGLAFALATGSVPLQLQFDVDVRDSVRERGPRRRAENVSPD